MAFQLGIAAIGLSLVAVALWAGNRSPAEEKAGKEPAGSIGSFALLQRILWLWAIALVAVVALTLSPSALFWRVSKWEELLIYPWQVLALTGLPLAFLAGSVFRLDRRLARLPAWSGVVALVVLSSYPYLAPRYTQVDPGSEPVAMFQPAGALAPQIMILDTEITPPLEITPTLTLTVTWQAVEPVAEDYTVFVHALTPDGIKVAQRDTRPCDGECPTNTWQPGEIVVDRYELDLAPDASEGPSRLALGLYVLDTGERVDIAGREDRMVFLDVP